MGPLIEGSINNAVLVPKSATAFAVSKKHVSSQSWHKKVFSRHRGIAYADMQVYDNSKAGC